MSEPLAGRRVLVLGLGLSGRSAARFCAAAGADVTAADERDPATLGDLPDLGAGVARAIGVPFPDPAAFDLVIASPGVPPDRYRGRARRVWNDVELAFRHLSVPVVAVTGSNGKSTTTRLVEALLRAAGLRAEAAGNIGVPALDLVGRPLDVAVLEVSSFQLETIERFRPRVAVVLNVTEDHIDRHGSFAAYAAAKARILENQEPGDTAVLSADDPEVARMAAGARGRVLLFSLRGPVAEGAWLDAGSVCLRDRSELRRIPLEGLRLRGLHNLENVTASLLAVHAFGADVAKAAGALPLFEGLPHRTELVRERGGVAWINDSKGTNVGAAARSLESFSQPVIWIAGGKDKHLDFAPLAGVASGRVRAALLIGETAPQLARALRGAVPCEEVGTLGAAVARADALARPGDVVLLSPACASFDQFESFEDRGERFRAAVRALPAREEES